MNNFYESEIYRYYVKSRDLGKALFYYLSGNSLNVDNIFFDNEYGKQFDNSQNEMMVSLGNILFDYFSGRKLSENELSLIAILSNDEKMYAMLVASQYNVKMGKKDFIDSCLIDDVHLTTCELENIINSPSDNDKRISAMQIAAECNLKAKKRNYKIFCQNAAGISTILANNVVQKKKR